MRVRSRQASQGFPSRSNSAPGQKNRKLCKVWTTGTPAAAQAL